MSSSSQKVGKAGASQTTTTSEDSSSSTPSSPEKNSKCGAEKKRARKAARRRLRRLRKRAQQQTVLKEEAGKITVERLFGNKLPKLSDQAQILVEESIRIYSHYLDKQEKFRSNGKGSDRFFPPNQTSLRTEEVYEWAHAKDINDDAMFEEISDEELDELRELVKLLLQGELGDCYLVVAIYLLITFHPELARRLIVKRARSQKDPWVIRIKVYGVWVVLFLDQNLPVKKDGSLAFISMIGDVLLPCVMEKAAAKLNRAYFFLTGGYVGEAMSLFCDCFTKFYNPLNMIELDLAQVIYSAFQTKKMVAFGTVNPKPGDPKKPKVEPNVSPEHAYAGKKVYVVRIKKQVQLLVLMRDPNGHEIITPFSPGQPMFNLLDGPTQDEMRKDLAEKGCFVVPLTSILHRFDTLEVIELLPPRPASHKTNPTQFKRNGEKKTSYSEHLGVHGEPYPPIGFYAKAGSKSVILMTQIEQRFADPPKENLEVSFDITDTKGKMLDTRPVNAFYQPALTFMSDKDQKCLVVPRRAGRCKGMFFIQIWVLEEPDEDHVELPPGLVEGLGRENVLAAGLQLEDVFAAGLGALPDDEEEDSSSATCRENHSRFVDSLYK